MLSREQIALMPAGRALDALVAATFKPKPTDLPRYDETGRIKASWVVAHVGAGVLEWQPLHSYSTDIAAAWLVVEALLAKGWHYCVASSYVTGTLAQLKAEAGKLYQARADTAPLAICRVALLALANESAGAPTLEKGGRPA